jgi:hypothetical protein
MGREPHMLGEELKNSLAEEVKLSQCSMDMRENYILYLSRIFISLDAWEEAPKFRTM